MKRRIALGLALLMVAASIPVEAQLGGLLRKKAREVIGGKEAAPTPAPKPGAETPAAPPATPPPGSDRPADAAAKKTALSPLEMSELPVRRAADHVLRGSVNARPNGDWEQLPSIPAAAVAAAYGLSASAQVALVETVGTALKTLVMSATFMAEHAKYILSEHQAVDHGLTGVVGPEEAFKKNDWKTIQAINAREMIAMGVDAIRLMSPDAAKRQFTRELAEWKADAAKPKAKAVLQKLVAAAQPLEALAADDEKFLRGYAVLNSISRGGPDTEEAVFAIHRRVTEEKEQLAYDAHNLKGQLKQQLTTFVAVAATVNFDAPTREKDGKTLFVNPADEGQGALWKACFRAGGAPTAAALKLARAWLAEL